MCVPTTMNHVFFNNVLFFLSLWIEQNYSYLKSMHFKFFKFFVCLCLPVCLLWELFKTKLELYSKIERKKKLKSSFFGIKKKKHQHQHAKKKKNFFFQVKHKPKKEEYRNIKKKFMKKNIEKSHLTYMLK